MMTPEQKSALEEVLGYIDAYKCGLCGGETAGQHSEYCPVTVLRNMVATPKPLYDWSNVPSGVMWIARDGDGEHHFYYKKPHLPRSISLLEWITSGDYISAQITPARFVEWIDSREKRPPNL